MLTGSDGFVASNLLLKLADYEVIALDCLKTKRPTNIPAKTEFLNHDLSIRPLPNIPKLDLIIHLAAIGQLSIAKDPTLLAVNTAAMLNVLELARVKGAGIIYASSCSVYGEGLDLSEDDLLNPMSLYAVGKCAEERIAHFYHEYYGLNTVILRFSNCFGDTTHIENKVYPGKKDVIRIFMEKVLAGEPVPLVQGRSRDFTYIDDVTDAILAMLPLEGFHIFNVATGVETFIKDLPAKVGEALGMPVTVEEIRPRETDDLLHRSINIDKISKYWDPKHSLDEGIKLYAEKLRGIR